VPGAGKTTILLALILKLMECGVNPENMYVMTYMESAARNFKDRIKRVNPDSAKMPNISTIHGLALRILKENSNFERIGLNPDFEICDDTQRGRIIKSISKNINKQDLEDFDRAISVLKLSGADINPDRNLGLKKYIDLKQGSYNDMKLSRFLKFFFHYQNVLKEQGLIDYDDILISAVNLLTQNKDILSYYQEVCEYIIEDEAQDSSYIQQKLVNLLGSKHGNIIRCGDINQAITTTFTNADVDGFKQFIESSFRVDMNCSQRCSEGVWKLANSLVEYGNNVSNEPFYEIYMNPVEGKNPVELKPLDCELYKNTAEEKISIVNKIKSILKTKPDATIGILLRNNYQVNSWAQYINDSGLTAITRNECLGQKSIFKVIFAILKLISNPFDNVIVASTYRALAECGIFKLYLDKIIAEYDTDFISLDNDEIENTDLSRFHWDMNYWLSFPELTVEELVLKIGLNYFSEDLARSNIYLISTLCAKLSLDSYAQTIQRLEELSSRPTLSGFKFFSEDEEQDKTNGKIQIMTLHKSKGDEFDYVFLPEMTEKNLTLDIKNFKLKKSSDFIENVRALNNDYIKKSEQTLKEFMIAENYRLLYVAITRAKQRLHISAPQMEKYFGKDNKTTPSIIFKELLGM
ncbi:MAG: ATP-dependent helicase, partial [Candidatus Gastranaerophilales bacterium]|nr:ATP-dependent helicase [Candidatus Gastranaerophilales bacterium]